MIKIVLFINKTLVNTWSIDYDLTITYIKLKPRNDNPLDISWRLN